ncbi:dihydrolipoyl dehydrogenase [Hoeflea sp. WL0058]|uniref:Dihydrolipoyl dehydrogenase n=1 Tax=Flavimaribacter sediminis TaxID=2865987 RepID=A0AAE3D0E2_9HYPH|nr:dihydrolipoyl dehydrogenase [Flavimaribacter sediminis]MBW8636937.1 dihydrolipoyl dehydrogenase [Flavimaribacter sediminis]
MERISCEVLVLGAGPGGYVAAIRAAQLGLDTVIVEKSRTGGTCLNVGCVPSKALIHAADEYYAAAGATGGNSIGIHVENPSIDWSKTLNWKGRVVSGLNHGVDGLLKKSGARMIAGEGRMADGKNCIVETDDGAIRITAKYVVLAPGSAPVELPGLPFGGAVISSTEALSLDSIPGKLAVVGGGYIGLELGTAFAKLGSEVTVIEATGQLLPQYDKALSAPVAKRLKELGAAVHLNSRARRLAEDGAKLEIETEGEGTSQISVDKVLVTVGRKPNLQGWGLEELQLDMSQGCILVDETCKTSMTGVYAIGDVTGEPMLAHRAMAQAQVAVEVIAGGKRVFDPVSVPAICFTDPEIVSVGLLPEQAEQTGHDIVVANFPLSANSRAITLESRTGFVRIVARKDNGLVLGVQAAGKQVSELSASFSLALEMGACLEDIARTIHVHPTQSEAFPEAAMIALGRGLHI